jgi:L-histidine N-alpha-methyltransferase
VSGAALRESMERIASDYPALLVHGIAGDFTRHLGRLPSGGTRLVAFLGGTIGNFVPAQRAQFLADLRAALEPGDWLLLGTDLVKDPGVLVAAYDDASGVTAEFNRNVLHVLNRELGADFEPDAFDHVALWDAEREWIEMRLRAARPMRVRVAELDLTVDFAAGEDLHTEVSAKFRRAGVERELAAAGFAARRWWTDPAGRFAQTLAEAVNPRLASPATP